MKGPVIHSECEDKRRVMDKTRGREPVMCPLRDERTTG